MASSSERPTNTGLAANRLGCDSASAAAQPSGMVSPSKRASASASVEMQSHARFSDWASLRSMGRTLATNPALGKARLRARKMMPAIDVGGVRRILTGVDTAAPEPSRAPLAASAASRDAERASLAQAVKLRAS
jgi:hypothetical protein